MGNNALYGNKGSKEEFVGVKNLVTLYEKIGSDLDLLEAQKDQANEIIKADFKGTADTLKNKVQIFVDAFGGRQTTNPNGIKALPFSNEAVN